MSKTISEVQASKRDLEAKIAQMLWDFEEENGVKIEDCSFASYPTMFYDNSITRKIVFTISVEI